MTDNLQILFQIIRQATPEDDTSNIISTMILEFMGEFPHLTYFNSSLSDPTILRYVEDLPSPLINKGITIFDYISEKL